MASQGLINRIIDDFVDQMVQAIGTGGADVHPRAETHGLKPFQDRDLICGVVLVHKCLSIPERTQKSKERRVALWITCGRNPSRCQKNTVWNGFMELVLNFSCEFANDNFEMNLKLYNIMF
jgi:hypothetical protein